MKIFGFLVLLIALILCLSKPAVSITTDTGATQSEAFWYRFQTTIESHLDRPYVWGASGLKSFDCSGFVWRVMSESGVFIKRTTARKLYLSLPAAEKGQEYMPGNVVFFDDLKHCGIVSNAQIFYHAKSSKGTTLDRFDPYWRQKVIGFRAVPVPGINLEKS